MFSFITVTWNPVGGECNTKGICKKYCWARRLAKNLKMRKYSGSHRIFHAQLNRKFKKDDFVFVCDMKDLFEITVPNHIIQSVLDKIKDSPARFLLLTKNPVRYFSFDLPSNCVAGATIETDLHRFDRLASMRDLKHKKMVSVEPILCFSPKFLWWILAIKPEFVVVGYDNYKNRLDEPSLDMTRALIRGLKAHKIKVYEKTVREKWDK
jgi:protein gp37